MKIFFFLSIAFLTGISFSQSKKEQIEQLNNRVDSLNKVLSSERVDNSKKISTLESSKKYLEERYNELENNYNLLVNKVSILSFDLQTSQADIVIKRQEISDLQTKLRFTNDSIFILQDKIEHLILSLEDNNKTHTISSQVTDINGKNYRTVIIGSQTWMSENLDVDKFRNGDPIPEAKTDEEWEKAGKNKMPAWCYYDNDPKNALKYGKLYNWYAVNDVRGLAPEGWHIPSEYEFHKLFDNDSIGKSFDQLKSEDYWQPCTLIDEHYYQIEKNGFNAFPSKKRYSDGTFIDYESANFWTTTFWNTIDIYSQSCPIGIFFFDYNHSFSEISVVNCSNFEDGLSVRCLRD
jgi:uncharacterized protein (TIGR02145 family)